MTKSSRSQKERVIRSGYFFALLLLTLFGFSLIVIGASVFTQGSLLNVVLIGCGISMGPAAIVAALFRIFLIVELQYQITQPVLDEVKERLRTDIRGEVESIISKYSEEISILKALKDAGVIRPYRRRETAMAEFGSAIDDETSEVMVIGSSLKGLLQMETYTEIANKLRFKMERCDVRVKFLLTHPAVSDLRAGQEDRRFADIGREIIDSLRILKKWNVPVEHVQLYKGTPTCFAIKTGCKMLLNPYPYGAVAYDSPCLVVETCDAHPSYFYDEFARSHFGAWGTNSTQRIYDYDQIITELENNLDRYGQTTSAMLKQ